MNKITVILLVLLLNTGCISAKKWENIKSHIYETAIAAALGALGVTIGGIPGVGVGVGGMFLGMFAGEATRPEPEPVIVERDKKGDLQISGDNNNNFVFNASSEEPSGLPWFKYGAIALTMLILAVPRWRELALATLKELLGSAKRVAARGAEMVGAKHSRPKPPQ